MWRNNALITFSLQDMQAKYKQAANELDELVRSMEGI